MRPRLVLLVCLLVGPFGGARFAQAGEIDDLLGRLGSEDTTEAYQGYRGLLGRKDPAILERIVQRIDDWKPYSQQYGFYLVQAFPPADAADALRRLVTSPAPYVRAAAAAELHRRGERRMEPILLDVLEREDLDDALRTMILGRLYGVQLPKVAALLRTWLRADASLAVLASTLHHLLSVRDEGAMPVARALLETAEDASVRALAAGFLYRMGEETRAVELAAAIRSGEVQYLALSRVETQLRGAPHVAAAILDAFVALLREESAPSELLVGIRLVEEFRWAKAVEPLRNLLDHENTAVAQAALKALAAFPGAIGREGLSGLLGHEDEDRRLLAADALRRLDDLAGLDVVIEILRAGTTQRAEAARILGTFRVPAVVEPLLDACLDENVTVRGNAWNSLGAVLRALFPYRRFDLVATGYASYGTDLEREKAIEVVRAWWTEHRDRDW